MPIYLHSSRCGWSTNSSSMHSIVLLREDAAVPPDQHVKDQQYGWGTWTASSPKAKLAWLGQALRNQIGLSRFPKIGAQVAGQVLQEALGDRCPKGLQIKVDGYVDHESRPDLPLPTTSYGDDTRARFLRDAAEFLLDPRVVVLGGHNNGGGEHPFSAGQETFDPWILFREKENKPPRFRYDKRDDYYSVFQEPGTCGVPVPVTTRFRWKAEPGPAIVRSETPELVDVSIADFCTTGCAYCYRGSTAQGGWAPARRVSAIIRALSYGGTNEVALGGGEPLQHPEIWEILGDVAYMGGGAHVHVTTRELGWLHVPAQRRCMLEHVTAFGFSVDKPEDAARAIEGMVAEGAADRLKLQIVVGVMAESAIREVLDQAERENVSVLLLGYKTTGRGAPKRARYPLSPEILRHNGGGAQIGIDTVLAQQWAPWLSEHAWPGSYTLQEGAFSCFIDAVQGRLHRSSFEGPVSEGETIYEDRRPHQANTEDAAVSAASIQAAYRRMQERYEVGAQAPRNE